MDDIKLPSEGDPDGDRLFIRSIDEEVHFEKSSLQDSEQDSGQDSENDAGSPSSVSNPLDSKKAAQNFVTISFAKFVQLVANHSYIDVVDRNAEEPVVLSGNLLTDLANAHDRTRERRMPLMFVAGLVIGVILTYILLK